MAIAHVLAWTRRLTCSWWRAARLQLFMTKINVLFRRIKLRKIIEPMI